MYADPSVNVLSLNDLDGTVMNEIGFSKGVTGVLYVDEEIHRTPADAERYESQLGYLNQFQRSTLTSNSVFSVITVGIVPTGHDSFQDH
jgi:hypothetical protein